MIGVSTNISVSGRNTLDLTGRDIDIEELIVLDSVVIECGDEHELIVTDVRV
jgi:hypothetical protein